MAEEFNPLEDGHPADDAQHLRAFATTVISVDPNLAVLSLVTHEGYRFDIMIDGLDAEQLGKALTGIAEMTRNDPEVAEAYRQMELEMESVVPYGPN